MIKKPLNDKIANMDKFTVKEGDLRPTRPEELTDYAQERIKEFRRSKGLPEEYEQDKK